MAAKAVTTGCQEWGLRRAGKAVTTVNGKTAIMVGTAEMADMGAIEQKLRR